jgi:hypothetical protein
LRLHRPSKSPQRFRPVSLLPRPRLRLHRSQVPRRRQSHRPRPHPSLLRLHRPSKSPQRFRPVSLLPRPRLRLHRSQVPHHRQSHRPRPHLSLLPLHCPSRDLQRSRPISLLPRPRLQPKRTRLRSEASLRLCHRERRHPKRSPNLRPRACRGLLMLHRRPIRGFRSRAVILLPRSLLRPKQMRLRSDPSQKLCRRHRRQPLSQSPNLRLRDRLRLR